MTVAGVADTHAALWYVLRNPELSSTAHAFIENAAQDGRPVLVASISLAEIVYLIEKNRLPSDVYTRLTAALAESRYVLQEAPLTLAVVDTMRRVPRTEIPELPDRIVAATALHYGVPVLSRDREIQASGIPTVW